jgi:sterol desaturase/sphingolipid hydroxylase (fatty acid hydroxylase superfamily)
MAILNIKYIDVYVVFAILILFGIIETYGGLYGKKSKRSKNDWYVELFSTFHLFVLIKPIIFFSMTYLLINLLPQYQNSFSDATFWISSIVVIFGDDFLQYWYHRKAHKWSWLWKLHRPHHSSREMGVLVSYRNAIMYYVLMPNIWWLAMVTYFGLYQEMILAIILKQIIVTGAHSEARWDSFLYKYKSLHPIAWVIERVISTPATHFAHHGKTADDGISNPDGNFSNMFFLWDVIFGTARITRKYPTVYGIPDDPDDDWKSHLYYPFIKSNKADSEIAV